MRREDVRLLVLIGPGGVGKTRLAARVAEVVAGEFAHGVAAIDLVPVRDPGLLTRTMAHALGLRPAPDEEPLAGLLRFLADHHLLLLLDNLEHLMTAVSTLAQIVEGAPKVKVLVTSRARVPLAMAYHLQVLPLRLPTTADDLDDVATSPAVRLFVERARAVDDAFVLSAANAAATARICGVLDGLPLAIELAAARINALPPAAMLARLDDALSLLTYAPFDAVARHRTMRAAIAWGYTLLDPPMQQLFRRLCVFRGGFTLRAAESVGGDGNEASSGAGQPLESQGKRKSERRENDSKVSPPRLTFDLLAGLIDRSMVQLTGEDLVEPRYRVLETLREFGRERLADDAVEEQATLDRHAAWVLALTTAQMAQALRQLQEDVAFVQLDLETGNIRAALDHTISTGDAECALRLIDSLWLYWTTRGSLRADEQWIDHVLAMPAVTAATPGGRAAGFATAAWVKALRGKGGEAQVLALDAQAAARAAGDLAAEARAGVMLSLAHSVMGEIQAALATAVTAVDVVRRAGDRDWLPFALNRQGMACVSIGDYQAAAPLFTEALAEWRATTFGWGIGSALDNLGHVARHLGDWEHAVQLFHEQLLLPGHPRDAWGIVNTLGGLAEIAIDNGDPARGAQLLGAAGHLLEESGITLTAHEAENRDRARKAARLVLGDERLAAAEAVGSSLSYEAIIATGLEVRVARERLHPSAAGLSPREIDVLRLLVDGLTDREMAARLFLGVRTIESHLASARRKLGVANRTEAATAAYRLGLTRSPLAQDDV